VSRQSVTLNCWIALLSQWSFTNSFNTIHDIGWILDHRFCIERNGSLLWVGNTVNSFTILIFCGQKFLWHILHGNDELAWFLTCVRPIVIVSKRPFASGISCRDVINFIITVTISGETNTIKCRWLKLVCYWCAQDARLLYWFCTVTLTALKINNFLAKMSKCWAVYKLLYITTFFFDRFPLY